MPSSSRRGRASKPRPKKAILDVGDGWSRVEYGHRAQGKGGRASDKTQAQAHSETVDKELSVEKMKEEHKKIKTKWVESEYRKRVVEEMDKKSPNGGWCVKKALCIALGTLSADWHVRVRSAWQFALFMDIVEIRMLAALQFPDR